MRREALLLVGLTLVACSSTKTTSRRDAAVLDGPLATSDIAAPDIPAGADEHDGPAGRAPEAAPADLPSLFPEDLRAEVASVDTSEVLSGDAERPDQTGSRDASATEATETTARDAGDPGVLDGARPDAGGDLHAEIARDVQPPEADGSLAAFCSGDLPHMLVNGIDSRPAMRAAQLCFECCAGGDLTAETATYAEGVQFAWQGLNLGVGPTVVDLAAPPKEWQFWLVAGCDPVITSFECGPKTTTCTKAGQVYQSGFRGTLELTRTSDYKADATLCLHFEPPAGAPSSSIRSLDLYAPHVVWSN